MHEPIPPALARRQVLMSLLADGFQTADALRARLRPAVSPRTLSADLAWLRRTFPEQIERQRGGDARIVRWRLVGLPPVLLPVPIATLTHDELAALLASRGVLRAPESRTPGWERPSSAYAGDLSAALHGLLERCGLADEARAIAPATIGVSRFGIAAEATGALAALQRALRTGQAARFSYRNRRGAEHACHVWPIRLVLIKGEWHCFAWSGGKVKQYALARITSRDPAVTVDAHLPAGAPARPPHDEVDSALASGFHATGSAQARDRVRIELAISPDAWPSIADRTWGENQRVDDPGPDLPDGWRRLSFTTSGLPEARHWVLSFGSAVRALGPPALVNWLREQAQTMVSVLPHIPAIPPAHVSDTVTRTT